MIERSAYGQECVSLGLPEYVRTQSRGAPWKAPPDMRGGAFKGASPLHVRIAPKNLSPTYFVLMLYAVSFVPMANSEQPFIA